MSEESIQYICPKCRGALTPWNDTQYVCEVCGFGKRSFYEFELLQKTKVKKELQHLEQEK